MKLDLNYTTLILLKYFWLISSLSVAILLVNNFFSQNLSANLFFGQQFFFLTNIFSSSASQFCSLIFVGAKKLLLAKFLFRVRKGVCVKREGVGKRVQRVGEMEETVKREDKKRGQKERTKREDQFMAGMVNSNY